MRKTLLVLLALLLAFAQGQRAWMDLQFGDSPEIVHEKMERMLAEGRIATGPYFFSERYADDIGVEILGTYDVLIAGVDLYAEFFYHEGGLWRIDFLSRHRSAAYWDAILRDAATLRAVLTRAHGEPTYRWTVNRHDLEPYTARSTDRWDADGVTYYLGLREAKYEYSPMLRIELASVANELREAARSAERDAIEDAADGF